MNKKLLLIAGLALLGGIAYVSLKPKAALETAKSTVKYQCPMHPQIVRDEPGDCPICHMKLEKVVLDAGHDHAHDPAGAQSHAAPPKERKIAKYRHPMDPKVFADKPAKDSMGMDFIPVYEDELGGAKSGVPGHAAFSLSESRQQLIGVKSEAVERREIIKTLRLPGRVGEGRSTVLAQALEMDGGSLKSGLKATIKIAESPPIEAVLTAVDSRLDSYSRTFGVILALTQPAPAAMRPGVYCDVRVELKSLKALAVPKDAVLDTGERQLVFVAKDGGRFEPRAVELGREGDVHVEIIKGLGAGERVVIRANFLIDSESRFKAAVEQF